MSNTINFETSDSTYFGISSNILSNPRNSEIIDLQDIIRKISEYASLRRIERTHGPNAFIILSFIITRFSKCSFSYSYITIMNSFIIYI